MTFKTVNRTMHRVKYNHMPKAESAEQQSNNFNRFRQKTHIGGSNKRYAPRRELS